MSWLIPLQVSVHVVRSTYNEIEVSGASLKTHQIQPQTNK